MALPLQYEVSLIGEERVRSFLRGVERETKASDNRIASQRRQSAKADPMFGPGRREAAQAAVQRHREEQRLAAQQSRASALAMRREQADKLRSIRTEASARQRTERIIQQQQTQWIRARTQMAQQAEQAVATRRAAIRSLAGGAARSVGGAVGNVVRIGTAAAGMLGSFGAAEGLRSDIASRRRASELANQAGDPRLKAQLLKESGNVVGFSREDTMGAMGEFVSKTGNLEAARSIVSELGDETLALAADFSQMGEMAGQVFNGISDEIKDPIERVKALKTVLRGWGGMGNIGTVEIKDLAQYGGRLGAASRKYAGGSVQNMLKAGAVAEAAAQRGGAVDAAEATTAVVRLAEDLTKHPAQKAMKAMGINAFADDGHHLKGLDELIPELLKKTGGNLVKLQDVTNAESAKAVLGFAPLFNDAEAAAKTEAKRTHTKYKYGDAGTAAVKAEFERYMKASLSDEDVHSRAASRREDPDVIWTEALKRFNTAVGTELTPVAIDLMKTFERYIPVVRDVAHATGGFMQWLLAHPAEGIGAIIAASVGKDLASAGIGAAVQSTLTRSLSSMTIPQATLTIASATLAVAAWTAAYDQAKGLDKQLGTDGKKGSIFSLLPGFDENGKFGVKTWGKDIASLAFTPVDYGAQKGAAGMSFARKLFGVSGGSDDSFDVQAKQRARSDAQSEASTAIQADQALRERIEAEQRASAALTSTTQALETFSSRLGSVEMPSSGGGGGYSPSPRRTNPIVDSGRE